MKKNKGDIILSSIIVLVIIMFAYNFIETRSIDTSLIPGSILLIIIGLVVRRNMNLKVINAEPCCVCGNIPSNMPISDGRICRYCVEGFKEMPDFFTRVTEIKKSELLDYRDEKERDPERKNDFHISKRIGNYIEFDNRKGLFRIIPKSEFQSDQRIYNCNDLIEYELMEDGISVTTGGFRGASASGISLGGVDLISGTISIDRKETRKEVENFKIKLTLNNFQNPTVYIEILRKKKILTNSFEYKNMYEDAQEILSTLAVIRTNNKDSNTQLENSIDTITVTEQLRELKALLDEDIITDEEFNTKKKNLLKI